jgi:hypothetical protein
MSEKFLDPYNGTLTEIFLATGGGVVKKNFLRKNFFGTNNLKLVKIQYLLLRGNFSKNKEISKVLEETPLEIPLEISIYKGFSAMIYIE